MLLAVTGMGVEVHGWAGIILSHHSPWLAGISSSHHCYPSKQLLTSRENIGSISPSSTHKELENIVSSQRNGKHDVGHTDFRRILSLETELRSSFRRLLILANQLSSYTLSETSALD